MKCPVCELDVGDYLTLHIRNCHPEHLQKQWENEGFTPQEIAMKWIEGCNLHATEFALSGALKLFASVTIARSNGFIITAKTKDDKIIESTGETLYAALCLAMDRFQFGEKK